MEILNCSGVKLPENLGQELDRVYFSFLSKMKLDKKLVVEVGVIGEEEIRILNRDYRGKDEVTDVLSFPMEPEKNESLLGAVYFCNSVIGGKYEDVSFGYCYLFAHSLLHLIGYEHGDDMFKLQEEIVDECLR